MNRKDFNLIAATLGEFRGLGADELLDEMAEVFARKLAFTNSLFDHERFIDATH